MQPYTGETRRILDEFLEPDVSREPGHRLTPRDFRQLEQEQVEALAAAEPELVADTLRALDIVKSGEPLVLVSAEVAHTQRLGRRELERRRRRRKAERN